MITAKRPPEKIPGCNAFLPRPEKAHFKGLRVIQSRHDQHRALGVHGEILSGLMVPLLGKMLEKTELGFELMNEAIKRRAEKP